MNSRRYEKLEALFHEARSLEPRERSAFLERIALEDEALASELKQLLRTQSPTDRGIEFAQGEAIREAIVQGPPAEALAPDLGSLEDPEWIAGYRILARLGTGGMGVVFKAEQQSPNRVVALKVMRSVVADGAATQRFRREGEILGRLHHPDIARILEAGTFDVGYGLQPYFAMDYVEGVDLASYVQRTQANLRRRVELIESIATAVDHAHRKGIVHRDLKPDNIAVTSEGRPVVLDFGIGKSLDRGMETFSTLGGGVLGTLGYMAPEQLAGAAPALCFDVYALGVMLYELLAGACPFDLSGLPIHEAVKLVSEQDPLRLGKISRTLRGDLDAIVTKAMSKEPERRYQSAGELAADLRRYLGHDRVLARAPSRLYLTTKYVRRHRGQVIAAAALLIGSATSLSLAAYATRQRAAAESIGRDLNANLYAAQMRLASEAARTGAGIANLAPLLDPWNLEAKATEDPDLRGWEWYFFSALAVQRSQEWAFATRIHDILPEPGGERLVMTAKNSVRLVRASDGEILNETRHQANRTCAAAWNPENGSALFIHYKEHLRLIDIESGAVLERLPPASPMAELQLSPNGELMAGGSGDRVLRVWRVKDHQELWTHEGGADGHAGGGHCFSPDNQWIAGTDQSHDFLVWHALTGEEAVRIPKLPGRDFLVQVQFSPDSERLAIATAENQVRILDLQTKAFVCVMAGHSRPIKGLSFSPDGRRLASASYDGSAALWDAENGKLLQRFYVGKPLGSVALSGDGKHLIASCVREATHAWDLDQDFPINLGWAPTQPAGRVNDGAEFALSRDGRWCATRSGRGTAVWRPELGVPAGPEGMVPGGGAALSRSGKYLAVVDSGPRVVIYANPGWKEVAAYDVAQRTNIKLAWDPAEETKLILHASGGSLILGPDGAPPQEIVFRFAKGRIVFDPTGLRGFALHHSAPQILRFGSEGSLDLEGPFLEDVPTCLELSADGTSLAVGTRLGEIFLLDPETLETQSRIRAHGTSVDCLTWHPSGTRIASGDADGVVVLSDPARSEPVANLKAEAGIMHLGFGPHGQRLTASIRGGDLVQWNAGLAGP